jgi:hypothetical protein
VKGFNRRRYCTIVCRFTGHPVKGTRTKVRDLSKKEITEREILGASNQVKEKLYLQLYCANLRRIEQFKRNRESSKKSMRKFRAKQAMRLDNELR